MLIEPLEKLREAWDEFVKIAIEEAIKHWKYWLLLWIILGLVAFLIERR